MWSVSPLILRLDIFQSKNCCKFNGRCALVNVINTRLDGFLSGHLVWVATCLLQRNGRFLGRLK